MLLAGIERDSGAASVQGQGLGLRAVLVGKVAGEGEVSQVGRQAEDAEGHAFAALQGLVQPGTDRLAGGGSGDARSDGARLSEVLDGGGKRAAQVVRGGGQRAVIQRHRTFGVVEQRDLERGECRVVVEFDQVGVGAHAGGAGDHRIGTVHGVQDLDDVAAGLLDSRLQGCRTWNRERDVLELVVAHGRSRIDRPEAGAAGGVVDPAQAAVLGVPDDGGFAADFAVGGVALAALRGDGIVAEAASQHGHGVVAGDSDVVRPLPQNLLSAIDVNAVNGLGADGIGGRKLQVVGFGYNIFPASRQGQGGADDTKDGQCRDSFGCYHSKKGYRGVIPRSD